MTKTRINLTKQFFWTIPLIFISGIIITVLSMMINGTSKIILLGVIGSFIFTLITTLLNLCYFIPTKKLELRLLAPGFLIIIFVLARWSQGGDFAFFGSLALINFGLGLLWYLKLKRTLHQKKL